MCRDGDDEPNARREYGADNLRDEAIRGLTERDGLWLVMERFGFVFRGRGCNSDDSAAM